MTVAIEDQQHQDNRAAAVGGPPPSKVDAKVDAAIRSIQDHFRRWQYADGYWWGELESNPTTEAEYLLLSYFLGQRDWEHWRQSPSTVSVLL